MNQINHDPRQLSIFDLKKERSVRQIFVTELATKLRIKIESIDNMIRQCCDNSSLFNENERNFLFDIAVRNFDGETLSTKQISWLRSLYMKTTN